MATTYDQRGFWPPEIVEQIIENVHTVPDLLNCACVSSTWSEPALKKLYKGSLIDMQFRTPDIGSLNCLFVASQERFRRNMCYVKHLLLSPERPAVDDAAPPYSRLLCFEKCRAIHYRQSTELLLLRSKRDSLASLTIPFEIQGQDWSLIFGPLFPRTIEFLAIDDCYCKPLTATGPTSDYCPADKFSNLKALTVYKSCGNQGYDDLCRLLDKCDLEFFHLDALNGPKHLHQPDTAELWKSLRRHENLQTLVLIIPDLPYLAPLPPHLGGEQESLWPKMKMLTLGFGDENWLQRFPNFEELQILCLRKCLPLIPTFTQNWLQKFAKCQNLQVLDIDFLEFDDADALLDIARDYPLLRKFSVRNLSFRRISAPAEALWIRLLRALPRLEHFELDLEFEMDSPSLARHCSHLKVLALPRARLLLSPALLTDSRPFQHLETMHFADIKLAEPRMAHKIGDVGAHWRRTFPMLQGTPCPVEVFHSYLNDLVGKSVPPKGPALSGAPRVSSYERYRASLRRTETWKVLQYPAIHNNIRNMRQRNLETEILGWPVVPLIEFYDRDAKRER